jgi:hypothetical protein
MKDVPRDERIGQQIQDRLDKLAAGGPAMKPSSPERMVRRGILSCPTTTGSNCSFILLLTADTRK